MKHLLWGAFAAFAIACGGGAKKPEEPKPEAKSACAVASENLTAALYRVDEDVGLREDQRPTVVRIFTERCEGDAWADGVVACFTAIKVENQGDDLEACGDMLTDAQEEAVKAQLEREGVIPDGAKREMENGDAKEAPPAPAGAAPPPPPDDPCGGGA